MKITRLVIATLALALSAYANESRLEVRILKVAGAQPSDKTLESLAEDPGAQVASMLSMALPEVGEIKIRQVTPYRFASEFTSQGEPDSFITRDLGWTGNATVANSENDQVTLKLNLSNVRIATPHVYEVKGVQVTAPAFTSVNISDQELALKPGIWRFVKGTLGEETFYWAVRVTASGR